MFSKTVLYPGEINAQDINGVSGRAFIILPPVFMNQLAHRSQARIEENPNETGNRDYQAL